VITAKERLGEYREAESMKFYQNTVPT